MMTYRTPHSAVYIAGLFPLVNLLVVVKKQHLSKIKIIVIRSESTNTYFS